ncbi:glycosyltransferase [Oceanicoccus sagamiensis]|uniref:Glycosyl transferase n=1 Tax=Oceanicoccus sagamiensis TaxID=716816 RepID=A0A1X9N707_9GAMM|nr:glycosyltransferase [Oceanicoccus sagamiensis]ARN73878.1 glycosyl transferase [Oceanicoccus sagamiensis]
MSGPIVSVIMATYNHADFVQEAIESVLLQDGVEFEFLIADDGSSDATRDVVASIIDPRIKFFPNTVNRGACVVTNELIAKSSGKYIALMNSDDSWVDKDKLSYQVKVLEDMPNVGACFGKAQFVDVNGDRIEKSSLAFGTAFDKENRSQGQWLRYFFDFGNCICHPSMLIRRSCYESVGVYNNRLRQLPDFDMWIRLVKHYDIYISDRELINFRVLPGENASSQTSENSIRTINEHYIIANTFFDNVSSQILIDGFSDLLVFKDIPSRTHQDIEIAKLFLIENQWLGKPYKMIGLSKMFNLFNSAKHIEVLEKEYGLDDRWYQKIMSEVDVLRPKFVAEVKDKARTLKSILLYPKYLLLKFFKRSFS